MTVKANTPTAAAANPAHPDHARWVKEQTLRREVEHAKTLGLSTRDAETANIRNLERLAARKRERRFAAPKKPQPKPQPDKQTLSESGVVKRIAPAKALPVSPCGHCGVCHNCRRERRMSLILDKARKGDTKLLALAWEITGLVMACQARNRYQDLTGARYDFHELTPRNRIRARNAGIDAACDRSVPLLGNWR